MNVEVIVTLPLVIILSVSGVYCPPTEENVRIGKIILFFPPPRIRLSSSYSTEREHALMFWLGRGGLVKFFQLEQISSPFRNRIIFCLYIFSKEIDL